MAVTRQVTELFAREPSQWGLRGDSYLWQEMANAFEGMPLPVDEADFSRLLEGKFLQLVGVPVSSTAESVFVRRLSHGGMSSGHVSLDFWRERALPLLRLRHAGFKNEREVARDRHVELASRGYLAMNIDLSSLSVRDLLGLSANAIAELRKRGIVRTGNNPIGDYTEWLVASALSLSLSANSAIGFDAQSEDGARFQIKGRRVTSKNPSRQLSAIRNLEAKDFDFLIAVVFDESYEILAAVQVPHAAVGEHAAFRRHVNAHVVHVNAKLLSDPRVSCVRDTLAALHQPTSAAV